VGAVGLAALIGICYLLSRDRAAISWRLVAYGLSLQLLFAVLVIGVPALGIPGPLRFIFDAANDFVLAMLRFTENGSRFVFGDLLDTSKIGFVVAVQVLPTIIFFSTLMAILYHLGLMQFVVSGIAKVMQRTMKTSGAESLSAAANIFVGQTEAPLVIRPFVARMTNSELFCVMVGGMATVAGGVMAAYVGFLKERIPDIAGHLLTASVLSAPAALLAAKMMYPETETPETFGKLPEEYRKERIDSNVIEAAARGASEGMSLAINVAAMLIAFIAVIALLDAVFAQMGDWIGFPSWGASLVPDLLRGSAGEVELSFSLIMGWIFAPLSWLMGIPWSEATTAGVLLGQKTLLNEFVAYVKLGEVGHNLSERTVVILSYALCGFANFSSIGIQIGGIGAIAPNRRGDLARLGIRAVIAGSIACFMTACFASLLY
jgi:concentrative nucleoside transporter, CNT family